MNVTQSRRSIVAYVRRNFFYDRTFYSLRVFDFFNLKFDHSSYLKICAKYHFVYCDLLYQYKFFKNDLNLTMFAYIF